MIAGVELTGLSINDIESILDPKSLRQATTSTINKVASSAASKAKKTITSKYVITQKNLTAKGKSNRNGMRVSKALPGGDTAFILSFGNNIPVINFKVTPKTPEAFRARKRGKGVTYSVKKGKKVRVRKGFVARMNSGHVGVFVRKGVERTPIRELFGPSIPQMLEEQGSLQAVREAVNERFPVVYKQELTFRLRRMFR